MVKRLLSSTPGEILAMKPRELLSAIRMSEGRVLSVSARVRGPNLVDGVANAEVAAAFGADLVGLGGCHPDDPYIPGWRSKDADDSASPLSCVQIVRGTGYTFAEIRRMIGRPVGVLMVIADAATAEGTRAAYGRAFAEPDLAVKAYEQGADYLILSSWAPWETVIKATREIRKAIGPDRILEFRETHGPGLLHVESAAGFIQPRQVSELVDAGVDIVGLPAPGTYPGWRTDKCAGFVDVVHRAGALCSLGVHTSQEGAQSTALEHIALWAKMAGADIHEIGDSGYTEEMALPENILAYGLAIRGRRHHYRRMATSILR